MENRDRRAHRRVHFSPEDGVAVLLERTSPDGNESMLISALILSISEGGLSFVGKNPALVNLQVGDRLHLIRVMEPEELTFLRDVALEVRHSLFEPDTEHVLAGVRFLDINDTDRERIAQFVSTR